MIRKENTPLTLELINAIHLQGEKALESSVHEQSSVDDLHLLYSMQSAGKMELIQRDLKLIISRSINAHTKYTRDKVRKGNPLNQQDLQFYRVIESLAKIPDDVYLEPEMFKDALHRYSSMSTSNFTRRQFIEHQAKHGTSPTIEQSKTIDEDYDERGFVEGYWLNRYARWIYKTLDVLCVRYAVPLATNMLRAYAIARHWLRNVYMPYLLTKFGTPSDPIWGAINRGELIVNRGYVRALVGTNGEARRKSYREPTLSTNPDALWYENNIDGTYVRTTSFVLAQEMTTELFERYYPYLMPPKRGHTMLYNARNCNYDFDWHPKLVIGQVLTTARDGRMTAKNVNQYTLPNILGLIEKETRKQRELRSRLEVHTHDLVSHCIKEIAGYSLIEYSVGGSDSSNGKLLLVPLTSTHKPQHVAMMLSATTQHLKFCLGGASTSNEGYEPMVDVSRIETKEQLDKMRLPSDSSIGGGYLRKIMAGQSIIWVFFHQITDDVAIPVGAAELHRLDPEWVFGQFKGHRNGKINPVYRSAMRQCLQAASTRLHRELIINSSSGDLATQGFRYNKKTRTFNFI